MMEIKEIIRGFERNPGNLIPILQAIQHNFGYLPEEAIAEVAQHLKMSESNIYGVATFYTQFKFIKPGKHIITICQGTACHVRGSEELIDFFRFNLGIEPGQTTKDGMFTLERVACLGCCALAPVMVIDDETFGGVTTAKAEKIIARYKEEEK